MRFILACDRFFSFVTRGCGVIACAAMILLLFNVFYDVITRYIFNDVSICMQELEWHLFSIVFLLGTPFALTKDGHVRVDIFYEKWSDKVKAWVNLGGAMIFVLPFAVLVCWYGIDFAKDSYDMGEGSGDPGGLPYRWIIKSMIPVSFALMAVAGLGMVTLALRVLVGGEPYPETSREGLS